MSSGFGLAPQRARLDQAARKGEQLAASIQDWVAAGPWRLVTDIQEDRLRYTVNLVVDTPPPLERWALEFGEAVHHLRALLDNTVVSLGTEAGLTTKQLRKLQFPIAATVAEWRDQKNRIADLPAPLRTAIELVQPFQRNGFEPVVQDLLLLLRDLDNQDKHHVQVESFIDPTEIMHELGVTFETQEEAEQNVPPDVTFYTDAYFHDGACLLEHRTKTRIAAVAGSFRGHAQVVVSLPGRGDKPGITWILAALCFYTGTILEYLEKARS